MATTNYIVVRAYRDAEAWDLLIQRCVDKVGAIWRQIRDLDEAIAVGNLPSDSPEARQRDSLLDVWQAAQRDLYNKQRQPHQPLGLQDYLEACHSIDVAMPARDVLDPAVEVATHGQLRGRSYPRHIEPSAGFAAEQLGVWHGLASSFSLGNECSFPCLAALEAERQYGDNRIVGCSGSLSRFMKGSVEGPVERILEVIAQDARLCASLGVRDFVRNDDGDSSYFDIERMNMFDGMSLAFGRTNGPVPHPRPILVSCYRPPSRLSLNEIVRGLRGGAINVWRDVICKRLATRFSGMAMILVVAVITRLFHHMVHVGVRFGYICTGEALIFLEMTRDLMSVRYSVCVPRADVDSDVVTGLHRTAAAQVLAFTLRAMAAERIAPERFVEASRALWDWHMNVANLFNQIPPVMRKQRLCFVYDPENWRPFLRYSPLRPRKAFMLLPGRTRRDEAAFNDIGVFRFLAAEPVDQQQPLCIPGCLWGIGRARGLDSACPNAAHHGDRHILPQDLLNGLTRQLDADLASGNRANYRCLGRSGPLTVLFKVRLASQGYTLLLKGVKPEEVDRLRREAAMYGHLLRLQGNCVPLCFGMINTQGAIVEGRGRYSDFMVFGGFAEGVMPLQRCLAEGVDRREIVAAVDEAFRQIHGQRVLHLDPEPRNMLYDASSGMVVVADFEKAVWDAYDGQQVLDALATRDAVVDNLAFRRRKINGRDFWMEQRYVRQRVEEFCERGW